MPHLLSPNLHHVVIIGGGFGGLNAARALRRAPVRITLIDRHNHHLFQPLLYQVATGSLSPANIAAPLRAILKRQKNVRVLLGEITTIDPDQKRLTLHNGDMLDYDTLIVATGVHHDYFGHDHWADHAPGLKTIDDATYMRKRILLAFEAAEHLDHDDSGERAAWLTFIVVGGGPTGVELTGALGEIANDTLKHDFHAINSTDAHIILVEGRERILPTFPASLSARAEAALRRLGAQVRTGALVTEIDSETVILKYQSDSREEQILARTVLWAAGMRASALGSVLAETTGVELDRTGRVIVQPDLTLPDHPEIFVVGDLAHITYQNGPPLPGVAQVAIQGGRYAARRIKARLRGDLEDIPFRYRDLGSMATIGRAAAVCDFGWLRLWGFPGWLAWLFVHLMNLVEFENRLLVFIQWMWSYFTFNRSARLITGDVFPIMGRNS
jgi:NADH dehydrogenase